MSSHESQLGESVVVLRCVSLIENYWRFLALHQSQGYEWPNGEAQPPAEGDDLAERHEGRDETASQNRSDSAGRLERYVGRLHDVLIRPRIYATR
jgi:hypothetical protein